MARRPSLTNILYFPAQDQTKGSYRRKGRPTHNAGATVEIRLKKDVNRERRSVEQQLRGLERDGLEFLKERKNFFEAQVKELQESFPGETNAA